METTRIRRKIESIKVKNPHLYPSRGLCVHQMFTKRPELVG